MTFAHLALLRLSSQHFSRCRTLTEKKTQSVLLQAHVPYGPGSFPCLLPGMDKH